MDDMTRKRVREHAMKIEADANLYEFTARCLWFLSGYSPEVGLNEASEFVHQIWEERKNKHE